MPARPSFSIHTYGCQMNVRDSDLLSRRLRAAGFAEAASEDEAEDVGAETVGHAAGEADGGAGAAAASGAEQAELSERLLLGLLADGAGVDEDDVRLVLRRGLGEARGAEPARQEVRVADVHLAAVGMDREGGVRGHGRAFYQNHGGK